MNFSEQIIRIREIVVKHCIKPDNNHSAFTLFFSISDLKERAKVTHVSDNTFDGAWNKGIVKLRRLVEKHKLKNMYLRVDWVTHIETLNWEALNKRLQDTKRNYFRYGLAFDNQLKHAFLEQELNANAMLYAGNDVDYAQVNEKNFNRYATNRYGQKATFDFSPQTSVYILSTEGVFCDTSGICYLLPAPGLNTGRRDLPNLDIDQITCLIDSGSKYLSGQVKATGEFFYGWHPCFDRKIATYNTLRHVSSTYAMIEAWEVTGDKTLDAAIKRSLKYFTETLIRSYPLPGGQTVAYLVDTDEEIKLGGNAVCLLALVKYTEVTGSRDYLPLLEQLAQGIILMQDNASGRFDHVLNANDLSVKEAFRIIYYDGEAAFGLMRLYGLTQDPRWLNAVEKAFEYFIANKHWKAHDHWLSYCVNELTRYKPEEKYFRFGIQNISGHLDFVLKRITTFPTLLELMMAAEQMLFRLKDMPNMRHVLQNLDSEKFYQALDYRAHYLLNGHFWPEMAMYFQNPARIVGSFFIRHHSFRVRIDDVEHYLSGFVAYRKYLLRKIATDLTHTYPTSSANITKLTIPANIQDSQYDKETKKISTIMALKKFDKNQLFRFFVDGRFHKKYQGWVGYEAGEQGSVQALLNGFSLMMDRFDLTMGLDPCYLLELHKVCMMGVQTKNLKSSPGDLRFLNAGMPFFAKTTTLENIHEILAMRKGDGTAVFNTAAYAKPAEMLDAEDVYQAIQREGKLNYRNWYPNLNKEDTLALEKKSGLKAFYETKHKVQMQFVQKVEEIVARFNTSIASAQHQEARLRAIALLIRELELLHPFPDGNCRTFACVLLTQLLLNYNFTPSILNNPNLDGEYSLEQWIEEIRTGMDNTQTLLKNPLAPVYDYSIEDAKPEDGQRFCEMAKELVRKIESYNEIFLTPQRLQQYTEGQWLVPCPEFMRFSGVGTYNTYSKGNVYFTCETAKWLKEGKNIRQELLRIASKGIKALVLDHSDYGNDWNIPVLRVNDAFKAFKAAAVQTRIDLDPLTILVTGTEGKSGAKVQLHHLLNYQTSVHGVRNSANTEVPVLRSLINLRPEDRVEINEVSVGADEAYRVERTMMVSPNLCLFTNIGPNHMDLHKTMENVLHAKSSVVEGLREEGLCIVNKDNIYYEGLVNAIRQRKPEANIITYGSSSTDAGQLLSYEFDSTRLGWQVHARLDDDILHYFLPLPQQHAPLASVGILLTIKRAGYHADRAANDYASFQPYETMGQLIRLHKKEGTVLFYDQSRRGGISGMRSAFADIANIKVQGKVVALVGGVSVLRDSNWTREVHSELAKLINNSPIDHLYTTGNYMEYVTEHLHKPPIRHSEDLDELAALLVNDIEPGDLLFIIGSAYLYLGRVSEKVQQLLKQNPDTKTAVTSTHPKSPVYRMLLTYQDVSKGITAAKASATHGVHYSDYREHLKRYPTFTDFRAALLSDFFHRINSLLTEICPMTCVNDEIAATDFKGYVITQDFCHRWFNNIDKNTNLPNKHLFGSFYDYGDPELLLHIQAATLNLHIGFINCQRTEKGYKPNSMSESEANRIIERFATKGIKNLHYRTWGAKWLSLDLGLFIEPTKAHVFNAMVETASSDIFIKKIKPLVASLT